MLRYYAPGPGGRMVRVKESSGTADEKAARNVLKDRIAAVRVARKDGGAVELPVNRRVTVAQVLDDYLQDLRLREAKGVWNEEYRLGEDSPLRAALGGKLVSSLTRELLAGFAEDRRKAKKSNATSNRDLQGLRSALRLAKRAGRIFGVPDDAFPEKFRERVRRGFFDTDEVERLCKAAVPWLAEIVRFGFATGWRRGELLGLRWEWIDLEEGEIRLPDTKNGEGRVIPIAGELVAIMERLKAVRTVERGDGSAMLSETVFHDEGKEITRKRFILAWNEARKAAKLAGRHFHDFRRSAARRLIAGGVSQAVAMKITGHLTPSIFRRYQIVETSDAAIALERVAEHKEKRSGGKVLSIHQDSKWP
jgi:integrase